MKKTALLLLLFVLGSCKSTAIQSDQDFKFEKLLFHSSMCFGFCPSYHYELRSDKTLRMVGDTVRGRMADKMPQTKVGYFTGKVPDSTFNKVLTELSKAGLDTLKFDGPDCCDGAVKTLIVYYNGKRKYLRAMFPPDHALKLIGTLNDVYATTPVTPTHERFTIEFDSVSK